MSRMIPFVTVVGLLLATGMPSLAVEGVWYVYRDAGYEGNHGEWTNAMPDEGGKMIKLNMVDRTDPRSGDTSIRVDVRLSAPNWCGLAVSCYPDYWGEKVNRPGFNLKGARKLVFWAKGARGDETIQVKAFITGDKQFGDSAPEVASRWIKLGRVWQKHEVEIPKNRDLGRVVTPFVFVLSGDYNRDELTFYFDDIHYVNE